MKKALFLATLLFVNACLFGQQLSPALQSVINAENSFAALSKNTNTRNAFLAYLSDSTVLFEGGKPIKGKQTWIDRKPDSSLLFWWPVFAGISKNGDMGFTTGPWEWSEKKHGASPLAFGYYATVWEKQKDDTWKMAADIGISYKAPEPINRKLRVTNTSLEGNQGTKSETVKELLRIDQAYIERLHKKSASYLPGNYTANAFILRNGHWPYTNNQELQSLKENKMQFSFEQSGAGISSSLDLGYTYGKVNIIREKDGTPVNEKSCYMRIWRKNDHTHRWSIILDIIGGE